MTRRAYCGPMCREGYRADRANGLIYGSVGLTEERTIEKAEQLGMRLHPVNTIRRDNGEPVMLAGWEDASRLFGTCRYCGDWLDA